MSAYANEVSRLPQEQWLKRYYFSRAGFSVLWVAAAFTVGKHVPEIAAALLLVYPAWDGLANFIDASQSGGLKRNHTQAVNVAVSAATTAAVALALTMSMNWVLGVFGIWAILAGLMQLGTALRRWQTNGAQWAMILSGAQSALAGSFFIVMAQKPMTPSIANVAGYAAVGAFYFLVSALWLTLRRRRAAA